MADAEGLRPADGEAARLVAKARALGPIFGERRAAANAAGNLQPETLDDMESAGLLDFLKPAAWGGKEADPRVFFDAQNAIAEHCLSAAWVMGVLNVQAFMLARFDAQAQADVWDGAGRSLVSSSFLPGGGAQRVDGGFRLTGDKWSFSSGSAFCQWALLGALIPPEAEGQPPEMRVFLVPRTDYRIVETWNTFGLRATGSNDIHVDDVFVPEHRTWRPDPGVMLATAQERPGPALYRLPWLHVFSSGISNLAIGAGRGAVRQVRNMPKRASAAADPSAAVAANAAVARAQSAIEAADVTVKNQFGQLLTAAAAGEVLPAEQAFRNRAQLTGMLREIASHVDALMLMSGGRGIHVEGPLTAMWLDLSAARHHPGNNPDAALQMLGGQLMA